MEVYMKNTEGIKTGKSKKYSAKKIIALGLPLLAAGVFVSSGFLGVHPAVASDIKLVSQTSVASPMIMHGSFAELADELSPTVVNVKVTKVEKAGFAGKQMQGEQFDEFFNHFFGNMPQQRSRNHKVQGAGSGVIISTEGYILSNNHVVENAQEVVVTLADKREFPAEIVGTDPKTDLAVLKVETDKPLPAASLGDSEVLKVGDLVVAIGNPFGLNHTVTSGIVSAKGRVIGAGPYDDFIQTDASINPGNSGGPLFNMKGEVIGINTAIIPQGQGIGFAIPIDTAKPLIPQLVDHGEITRGYLGVNIQAITADLAEALELENIQGALVSDVVEDSPAEEGGLKRGDVIVDFDGKTIEDSHDLPVVVAATPVGEELTVTVLRDGKQEELQVTVAKLDSDDGGSKGSTNIPKGKLGMQLQELSPQVKDRFGIQADKGVGVVAVAPDSPAADAGIVKGDVILEVNRKAVASIGEVKKQIKKAKDKDRVLLLVQRQNGKYYVPLELNG